MGKLQKTQLNVTNKSQEVSPFPAGDHKKRKHEKHKRNNTNDPQKKYPLETVSKNIFLECLNRFQCANLTLSSDVDQDT